MDLGLASPGVVRSPPSLRRRPPPHPPPPLPLPSQLLLLAAGLIMLRMLRSWMARLDADARFRAADATLEDPSQLAPVPAPSLFDDPTKSLTIVIPAYNEADRLPGTLEETMAYLSRRRDRQGPNFTYEVLVVDDGSRDGTAAAAFTFVRRHGFDAVRVLRLPGNRGKGFAVRSGALAARGEAVLMMDADGATRVSEVEKLEAKMGELCGLSVGGRPALGAAAGFVLGSRAHLQEAAIAQRTWVRNVLMHGFHFLVTLVVGPAIRDTQCGFKLFTRPAARALFPNQRLQRWAFDVELVRLAADLKVPTAEVAVAWAEIPGSKVRVTSVAHMAFELAAVAVGYGSGAWRAEGPQELHTHIKQL